MPIVFQYLFALSSFSSYYPILYFYCCFISDEVNIPSEVSEVYLRYVYRKFI